jgi:hypothetical protein
VLGEKLSESSGAASRGKVPARSSGVRPAGYVPAREYSMRSTLDTLLTVLLPQGHRRRQPADRTDPRRLPDRFGVALDAGNRSTHTKPK